MATCTHRLSHIDNADATSYLTAAFTPGANEILVVTVIAAGTTAGGTMTDSQSLGMTKLTPRGQFASSAHEIEFFISNAHAAASSMTVTFDCTGDASTGVIIFATGVSGIVRQGADAARQVINTSNGAAAGTPAITFASSCLTGNPTIVACGNNSNPANLTPPVSWTEAADTGNTAPLLGGEYATRNSGFTSTAVTWGGTSATTFGAVGIELDAQPASIVSYSRPVRNTLVRR